MHAYSVGTPYHPGRKMWPQAPQFNFRGGELELVLFYDAPTRHEIAAVKSGPAEFGLFARDSLVVLCYRFGPAGGGKSGMPWSDAPYSYHLVPAAERVPPPSPDRLGPDTRALLQVVLVNAVGGEILALRAVTFSPEFTHALYAAIVRQASRPWARAAYDAELVRLYADYPSSELLARACSITTMGGA